MIASKNYNKNKTKHKDIQHNCKISEEINADNDCDSDFDEKSAAFIIENRNLTLLPVCGIFGPNASGKSNVLRALETLLDIIYFGSSNEIKWINHLDPFHFTSNENNTPTEFELQIVCQGNIYRYSLSSFDTHIVSETLDFVPIGSKTYRFQNLFKRKYSQEKNRIELTNASPRLGKEFSIFTKLASTTQPLISTLIKLDIQDISPFSSWIMSRNIDVFLTGAESRRGFLADLIHKSEEVNQTLVNFLSMFDIDIDKFVAFEDNSAKSKKSDETNKKQKYYLFTERVPKSSDDIGVNGKLLSFSDESEGTQYLMLRAIDIIRALRTGGLLCIDELDSHLHPKITRKIIELFKSRKHNTNGAQLIFSSHDYTLMRTLNRDEIWLTEKLRDKSTSLFPISDYSIRNDLLIDKAYMEGRFGAIPVIKSSIEVIKEIQELYPEGLGINDTKNV